MIIDYISTIEEISIRDLLYNNWDTLVKEYIVGRDKFFNEKQNKVILDILESNLKDDLDNYSTWDLPDCFGVEDLKYDGICEIVPESKSSPINRINNLRKNIGYVREEILAYPEYF